MAMSLIAGIVSKIAGDKAADIVTSVGNVADKFITTGQEKEEFKAEVQKEINRHLEEMTKAQNSELELILKDVDSARNREVQVATSEKAPLINKIIQPILAIALIILAFVMFYSVMFKQLGAEKDIVIYVLGVLSAVVTQTISYYFGSSVGSRNKQDQIDKFLQK
jgi:Fe2+ transport system protein B